MKVRIPRNVNADQFTCLLLEAERGDLDCMAYVIVANAADNPEIPKETMEHNTMELPVHRYDSHTSRTHVPTWETNMGPNGAEGLVKNT